MKRSSKKVLVASLAVTMSLSMNAVSLAAAETKAAPAKSDGEIVVLYTNDIHCGINEKESMGVAGVAAYKADMIQEYGKDNVSLVDCGDAIQGSALGTLSNGSYMVDIMNAMGYDYAIFGNHEFDYSIPELKKLVEKAEAAYLSCNFKYIGTEEAATEEKADPKAEEKTEAKTEVKADAKTDEKTEVKADAKATATTDEKADAEAAEKVDEKLTVKPYEIKDYSGTKVAFVGITTPETLVKSTPTFFVNEKGEYIYSFCQGENGKELYTAVQTAVDAARKEGAKYVVALAHLGVEESSAPYRSTDVIANTKGIDVMLDGHSHTTLPSEKVNNAEGKEVLLSQTGTKLSSLGKLVIKKDGTMSTELIAGKDYTKKDEATTAVVDKIQKDLDVTLNQKVAQSEIELSSNAEDGTRAVRNRETAIGDLCADAYRTVAGADIAFVNGGGIRTSIKKGDITFGDIINVFPFNNELYVVEATGQEILDALEVGSRNTMAETAVKGEDGTLNAAGENGGFLQVSGLKYTIDPAVKSTVVMDENGQFVKVEGARRVKDVQVLNSKTNKYEALKADKTYTLASHNYMLKDKGDGFSMFADNKVVQVPAMTDNKVLITYITDTLKGTIGKDYAKPQGRITVKEAAAEAKKAA